jgi:hypothetical protein
MLLKVRLELAETANPLEVEKQKQDSSDTKRQRIKIWIERE